MSTRNRYRIAQVVAAVTACYLTFVMAHAMASAHAWTAQTAMAVSAPILIVLGGELSRLATDIAPPPTTDRAISSHVNPLNKTR